MRDGSFSSRPYFRSSTAELAGLVATSPAREVLLTVADELVHRDRPAAVMLRQRVAVMLDGSRSAIPCAAPVAEVVAVAKPRVSIRAEVAPVAPIPAETARIACVSHAAPEIVTVAAKPAKPARATKAAKRPGDIGWKPRSLEAIARSAGVAQFGWSVQAAEIWQNCLVAARRFGLEALGYVRHGEPDQHGYATWARGAERVVLHDYGALYLGDGTMRCMPSDYRDVITEAGRAPMNAEIERRRLAAIKAELKAKARAAWVTAKLHMRQASAPGAKEWVKDGARASVALAWKARAEYRAA